MADDFIDRGAERLREFVVVVRRRVGVIGDDEVMDHFIDVISCHSCFYYRVAEVQGLSCQQCHLPHLSDLLRTFGLDDVLQFRLLLLFRDRREVIIRLRDMLRDLSFL